MSKDTKGGAKASPASSRRGRPIKKVGTPLSTDPITRAVVQEAFEKASVQMPDVAEMDRLASIFTAYKAYFRDAETQRTLNSHARAAGDAIRALNESLPPLLSYHRARASGGDPYAEWQAAAIEKIFRAVLGSDLPRIEAQSNVPNVIKDWRWLVTVLLPVILPAFPDGTGISENGPASRFLAEMLPLISGDAPTPSAVATQFKKLSTREK